MKIYSGGQHIFGWIVIFAHLSLSWWLTRDCLAPDIDTDLSSSVCCIGNLLRHAYTSWLCPHCSTWSLCTNPIILSHSSGACIKQMCFLNANVRLKFITPKIPSGDCFSEDVRNWFLIKPFCLSQSYLGEMKGGNHTHSGYCTSVSGMMCVSVIYCRLSSPAHHLRVNRL